MRKPKERAGIGIDRNWFFACLVFIVGVSIYDTYLVFLYQDSILFNEFNPICELLIRKDPHQLSWFLLGKTLGNLGVVGTLMTLYRLGYRWTNSVATNVALFQLLLLVFLNFSDPRTGFLSFDGLFSHDPEKFAQGVSSAAIHGFAILGFLMVWVLTRIWWRTMRSSPRTLGTT